MTNNLGGNGQKSGGAGERASQVVRESADIPAPGPGPSREADNAKAEHGVQLDPQLAKPAVTTFKDMERQSRKEELPFTLNQL